MDLFAVIGVAVALSMDAFAVAVTNGASIKNLKFIHALKIAFFFGIFQALMPIIGWNLGFSLHDIVKSFDHWVAFAILSIIGGKMILESAYAKASADEFAGQIPRGLPRKNGSELALGVSPIDSKKISVKEKSCLALKTGHLFTLAVATSIDALAVGFSLSFLKVAIVGPALIIGAITFGISLAGVFIGEKVGHFFENKFELAGGIVLIIIGLKILLEHIC